MKIAPTTTFPNGTLARFGVSAVSIAAASAFAFAAPATSTDSSTFKTEVSRTAVTTLPAFTVEEAKSAKTHTLFMGADIALNLDRDLYHVKDVWGSNWVININGREKEISARQAPLNLKITPTLKLTETSATIVGFKGGGVFVCQRSERAIDARAQSVGGDEQRSNGGRPERAEQGGHPE